MAPLLTIEGLRTEIKLRRGVVHAIDRDCAATVMEPGMDSFYLWAEQEPPSFTATAWPTSRTRIGAPLR